MSQLFPRYADSLLWLIIASGLGLIILFFPLRSMFEHSAYATGIGEAVCQPVPFSHKHHVGDVGIDCRYCHSSVETSSFAGIPDTATCMGCHGHLWANAALLSPVRASFMTGTPLMWNRVNNLPDYVFFNHSIHVAKGVGCESCHGRVDRMPLSAKFLAFHMEDFLECHRHPERYVRPKDKIYSFGWDPGPKKDESGRQLVKEYHIDSTRLTECVTCHR